MERDFSAENQTKKENKIMKKKTVMRLLAVVLAVSLAATSGVPGTALTGIETVYANISATITDSAIGSAIKQDVTSIWFTSTTVALKDAKFAVSKTVTDPTKLDSSSDKVLATIEADDAGTTLTIKFSGLEAATTYNMFYDLGSGWVAYSDNATPKIKTTKKSIKDQQITLSQDTFTYNGSSQKPQVLLNGVDITSDSTNYDIKWSGNTTDVTSATNKTWVSVTAKDVDTCNYRVNDPDGTAETVTVYYTINPTDISTNGSYIKLDADSVAYSSGANVAPGYTLYDKAGTAIENTEGKTDKYTISYKNASQVSTDGTKATITLTGTGNYTGSLSASYTVTQAAASNFSGTVSAQATPTTLKVTVGGSVDTTGKYEYAISSVSAAESNFTKFQDSPEFTGLTAGTVYYVAARVKATKNVGASNIVVNSTQVKTSVADLSEAKVTITSLDGDVTKTSSIEFANKAIVAAVSVTLNGKTLSSSSDYEAVVYDQGTNTDGTPDNKNTDVGTVTVIVKGKGDYSGQATATFTIEPKPLVVTVTGAGTQNAMSYSGEARVGLTAAITSGDAEAYALNSNGTGITGLYAKLDTEKVGTANLIGIDESTFALATAGAAKNFKVTYIYDKAGDGSTKSTDITSLGTVTINKAENQQVSTGSTSSYTLAYGKETTLVVSNSVGADMEVTSVTNTAGIADYTKYFTIDLKNKTIKCIKPTEGSVTFTVTVDFTADAKKSDYFSAKADGSSASFTVTTERATPVISFTGATVTNKDNDSTRAITVLPTESESVVLAALGIKAQYATNDKAGNDATYADIATSKLTIAYFKEDGTTPLSGYPKAEDFSGSDTTIVAKISYAGDENIAATATAKTVKITLSGTAAELPASTTPTITAAETKFEDTTTVTIKAADGAAIYYTTDGTVPTTASTKYTAAFTIDKTTTVKAIAVEDGKDASTVASATFTKIKNGVVTEDGISRLYDGDTLVKSNFATIGGKKYYADKNGIVLTKQFITVKGSKYYADKNGVIVTGGKKKTADGSYVYADKNGKLLVNAAKTVSGSVYVADKNGKLVKEGFATVKNGNTYYLKGYKAVKNKIFAYSDGKSYIANAKGVILKGNKKVTFNKKTYYVGKKGAIAKNTTKKISGKTYVFDKKGVLVTNKKYTIGKKTYTVNKKGVVTKVTTKK
jgi:hypothetical protein